jgi:hypothetical protein
MVRAQRRESGRITPGRNIAAKVPEWTWAKTVAFHRDRVGLAVRRETDTRWPLPLAR